MFVRACLSLLLRGTRGTSSGDETSIPGSWFTGKPALEPGLGFQVLVWTRTCDLKSSSLESIGVGLTVLLQGTCNRNDLLGLRELISALLRFARPRSHEEHLSVLIGVAFRRPTWVPHPRPVTVLQQLAVGGMWSTLLQRRLVSWGKMLVMDTAVGLALQRVTSIYDCKQCSLDSNNLDHDEMSGTITSYQ